MKKVYYNRKEDRIIGTAIQTVVSGVGVHTETPISVLTDFQNEKVLSVDVKGNEEAPQVGDVVLNMDRVVVSVIDFDKKFDDDGSAYKYTKDNICLYKGMLYRLIVPEISIPGTFNPDEWEELDMVDMICKDFESNYPYEKYQVISHDGVIYRALKDFVSHTNFNPEDWEELSQLQILKYTPGRYYHKDSVIYRIDPISGEKIIYIAKDNFTAPSDFDKKDWNEIRTSDETLMIKDISFKQSTKGDSTIITWTYRNPVTDETTTKDWTIVTGNALTSEFDPNTTTIQIDNFAWNEPNEIASTGTITPVDPNRKNPYYRGSGTTTQMNAVTGLVEGDIYDNTTTNTVWRYRGSTAGGASYTQANTTTALGWQNTGQPFNIANQETLNYSKVASDGSDTSVNNHGLVPTPRTYLTYENRQIKYFSETSIEDHKNPDIINLSNLWNDTNLEYLKNVVHNGFSNGDILINGGSASAPQWMNFKTYNTSGKYPNLTFKQYITKVEEDITDLQNRVRAIENAIYNWSQDKSTRIPRGNINIYSGGVGNTGILTKTPGNNTNDLRFQ